MDKIYQFSIESSFDKLDRELKYIKIDLTKLN